MEDGFDTGLQIAIIGMAARFPGARDVDGFWENLCAGRETIHFFTDDELKEAGVTQVELDNPNYVKAAPILDDIDLFDAAFFDYTPMEATFMDPQQRLLLECCWQALEHAGYTGERASDSIGVYVGIKMNTYVADFFANADLFGPEDKMQIMMGNADFAMGTRISYKLNLKGPSYMVQTACSTSLAAVHLACHDLLLDECRMALAGAVAVEVPHRVGYYYQYGGPASPDGHCRPFDAKAQGTVFGSGVGVVVLKRLENALADGDHIYAVIKGTAVNNDGALKASFTAPSVEGQTKVIMEALACANVDVDSISYVEAHGTATPLGDPIEMMALTNAFRAGTDRTGFCRIGSVKGNVGHLDAAAGMAGLIKTVLALKHKKIPPSLYFEQPNPEIDFANSPFYVNTEMTDWEGEPVPRRAGLSSFGFGGTNTHTILEEVPAVEPSGASRPWQLLMLSAKTGTALDAATANLAMHLKRNPDLNLADVAYTLQVGRPAFKHRRTVVCCDLADAASLLETVNDPRVLTGFQEIGDRPVVFMFSGQGAQYVNMGLELYQVEPVFREHVDLCAGLLVPHLGFDLRTVIYPAPSEVEVATQRLTQTAVTQPALFVVEYALAQLWQSWGVIPKAMIGHSTGEYVAACLAGVFSLEDGLALVATRGRLMQQLPCGSMLTVSLPEQETQPLLGQHLSLAAVNGPTRCVVSGPTEAVEELEQRLAGEGVACRRLHTSHAFHSAMMDPILEPFTGLAKRITLSPPQIPYISNVSGTWVTAAEATTPSYWANHLRQPVRFAQGLGELSKDPDRVLLEVGPGRTLSTLARQCLAKGTPQVTLSSLHDPKDNQSDTAFLLNTLGGLWLAGVKVNWAEFYANERRYRVPLPTYPFERRRYWFESPQKDRRSTDAGHPEKLRLAKQPDIADWFYVPSWKRSMPTVCNYGEKVARPSCWLLFVDECGLGSRLVERLEQESQDVIVVRTGSAFARSSDRVFTLNPGQRDNYNALLDGLHSMGKHPEAIIHLWSVTEDDPEMPVPERVGEAQERGFYSLLFLVQAIEKQGFTGALRVVVISNDVQEVTGEEALRPEKATLLGPVKVIPLEYPNISCRSVDVSLPQSEAGMEQLADLLLAEIAAKSPAQVAAYRGRHRWEQTFEPVRLEKSGEAVSRLRDGGVYLITGGLGNIGLVLAKYLAETVRAKLVLTGRSALPAAEEWEMWLSTHTEDDETSRKIQKAQELVELGAEVLVTSADVTNREQMQAVIALTNERFGTINGVFHAAGIGVQRLQEVISPIQGTDQAKCAWYFQPKLQGLLVLEQVLRGQKSDFCLLFSSLASILGGFGFAAYAAANIFMDAFTHQRNGDDSISWISVNWDTWQFDEQETASGTAAANLAILSGEGMEVFERIFSTGVKGQIVVSTGELNARLDQLIKPESPRGGGDLGKTNLLSSFHPRPDLRNIYVAPGNALERRLANLWQNVLGIERVGIHDNFFDLGGDSLIGLKLIAQLKQELDIEIPAVDLYQGPTVNKLADIVNQMTGQTPDDESARKAGQHRGAQRLERRRQQKHRV
jgi:acyl transferase domain-containing protein